MENRFLCPNCQEVEYFFDGEKLKCPNCNQNDFESALHQSEGNIEYQELSKLNKPFFELVFGEIYDCHVMFNGKIEKTTIVPVNSNPKFNQLFFLFDINYCKQNNPKIVETLKINILICLKLFMTIMTLYIQKVYAKKLMEDT